MNQNKLRYSCLALLGALLLISCNPAKKINKDFVYFQHDRDSLGQVQFRELAIQPGDLLAIQIFSKSLNQEQAKIFNITAEKGYLVDADGRIEIPVIGFVPVAASTRMQVERLLENRLSSYIKDPSVVVRFAQFKTNVLGEVANPGTKTFPTDRVTILDAISAAGDLTVDGLRQNVLVIREEKSGRRVIHQVDLRSAKLFQSPVYQLQQNDVVYVTPSNQKLKAVKERKNPLATVQIITSLVSLASTVVFLVTRN